MKKYYNTKQYLTVEALNDGTFSFSQNNIDYSIDDGSTWTTLIAGSSTPIISAGSKVLWRATEPTISSSTGIGTFSSTGKFNVRGNIMSLLYGNDFIGQTDLTGKDYAFYKLFGGCTNIVDTSNLILPATILAPYCYEDMFMDCEGLTVAPELPATTLAECCYNFMFEGCSSLTTAPELPATLADNCYYGMFSGCTNLNHITMLATDIGASNCLKDWVKNVASNGTFIKNPSMTTLSNGIDGIPNGWIVEDYVFIEK